MNGADMERTDPDEPQEPRRSRFEDLSVPVPAPAPVRRRTATVTTAALILLVSGALTVLTVFVLKPSSGFLPLYAVLGILQLIGAVLVFALMPVGRSLGIALGAIGVVVGFTLLGSSALNGLMTIALNGYVIYALASSGPSFRR
jgi:hypothetical protein